MRSSVSGNRSSKTEQALALGEDESRGGQRRDRNAGDQPRPDLKSPIPGDEERKAEQGEDDLAQEFERQIDDGTCSCHAWANAE